MNQITKYLELILLIVVIGCSQSSEKANFEMRGEEVTAQRATQKKFDQVERKLIKEGRVKFEVDDINLTRKIIFQVVDKYKGYISSDQEFKLPKRKSNTIIIRVPAENFDNLLNDATKGVKKFESKKINVKDVTEEFLDIQARLKTKKELESRYLDILKQAKNVTEILKIEKQIGQLRSEIESIEGRFRFLNNKISLSTLTMTFYESIPNRTEFGQKFKNSFRNGWDNLIWFFVILTNIWPFIIIGFGLIIGIIIYTKRK